MANIDKVAWIHIHDGRVLGARSHNQDAYFFPGGKRDPGESDRECLVREVREELNVTLVPESLRPLGTFEAQAHGKPAGVMVRLQCYEADYVGELQASSEIAEIAWLTNADRDRTSAVARLVFDALVAAQRIG